MSTSASVGRVAPGASARGALPALLVGGVCIGFAPIFAKHAVLVDAAADGSRLSPIAVAFWRMLIAAPLFAFAWPAGPTAGLRRQRAAAWRGAWRDWRLLLLPGLCFALDLGVWHTSFEYTSVANATLLANFAAVFVALFSWVWLGERFGALFIGGAALALAGMVGLVGASFVAAGRAWIGDLMGIFVALAYSGYLLSTKRALARHPVRVVMTWSSAACAGFSLLGALLLSDARIIPASVAGWLDVLLLALISQVAGQGLIAYGMRHLPASFSSVTLIIQPLCAAVFGWLLLAQPLSTLQLACGGLIIAGIFLAKRGSRV